MTATPSSGNPSAAPEFPPIDRHRIWVSIGAGGVGKTTLAAAVALAAAGSGKRALCLTVDPARRLSNSLGLASSGEDAHVIDAQSLTAAGLPTQGSLSVMMVTAKRVFDELVTKYASSDAARKAILENEFYEYLSHHLAGTHAYMAMERLLSVRDDPRYDAIVLDTPPTAHALDFLEAPERLLHTIDNPAIRTLLEGARGGQRAGVGFLARGVSGMLRAIGGITGAGFLDRLSEFVLGMSDLFAGFRERAERVSRAFRSPDVGYLVVATPAPLALAEAARFCDRLESMGLRAAGLIVNRVHPESHFAVTQEQIGRAAERRGLKLDAAFAAHIETGWRLQAGLARSERVHLGRLDSDRNLKSLVRLPRLQMPAFPHDVEGLPSLVRLAKAGWPLGR